MEIQKIGVAPVSSAAPEHSQSTHSQSLEEKGSLSSLRACGSSCFTKIWSAIANTVSWIFQKICCCFCSSKNARNVEEPATINLALLSERLDNLFGPQFEKAKRVIFTCSFDGEEERFVIDGDDKKGQIQERLKHSFKARETVRSFDLYLVPISVGAEIKMVSSSAFVTEAGLSGVGSCSQGSSAYPLLGEREVADDSFLLENLYPWLRGSLSDAEAEGRWASFEGKIKNQMLFYRDLDHVYVTHLGIGESAEERVMAGAELKSYLEELKQRYLERKPLRCHFRLLGRKDGFNRKFTLFQGARTVGGHQYSMASSERLETVEDFKRLSSKVSSS